MNATTLIGGAILALLFGGLLVSMARELGWQEAVVEFVLVGAVAGIGLFLVFAQHGAA